MGMILTSECEQCRYGIIDDRDKARIKVMCTYKGKEYYYGQCIPCENKTKKYIIRVNDKNVGNTEEGIKDE